MSLNSEIENIARCLFEIEISMLQLSAYEEGFDKTIGLPYRSEWRNMGEAQEWWIKKAKEYIKDGGISLREGEG